MSGLSPRTRELARILKGALRALPMQPVGSYSLQVIEITGPREDASGLMELRWSDGPSASEAIAALCVDVPGTSEGEQVQVAQLLRYERRLTLGGAAALQLHTDTTPSWSAPEQAVASLHGVASASEHVRIMHELAPAELKAILPRTASALEATVLADLTHEACTALLGAELATAAALLQS